MRTQIRRNALYTALLAASSATAVATATAIPMVSALAQTASSADCASCPQGVSPVMQTLIHDFVMTSIRRDALEATEDTEALGLAIQARHRALSALAFQAPANAMEVSAKLSALIQFGEDTERWSLRVVAEDAVMPAEGAR